MARSVTSVVSFDTSHAPAVDARAALGAAHRLPRDGDAAGGVVTVVRVYLGRHPPERRCDAHPVRLVRQRSLDEHRRDCIAHAQRILDADVRCCRGHETSSMNSTLMPMERAPARVVTSSASRYTVMPCLPSDTDSHGCEP